MGYTSFQSFALDQLGRVQAVRARKMFGGVGIYGDELFFAIMDDDRLWLKVDDTNRGDFEALGLGPFRPDPSRPDVMQYYPVPEEVLEDVEALRVWVGKALAVARRSKGRSKQGKK